MSLAVGVCIIVVSISAFASCGLPSAISNAYPLPSVNWCPSCASMSGARGAVLLDTLVHCIINNNTHCTFVSVNAKGTWKQPVNWFSRFGAGKALLGKQGN
ncbi:hypothetical protein F5J12DRAFT_455495 [Pisolithus orientalis]|uniref:uncharacterized protein n=1 Tax=Pisolithus orientalis TaxID=936130 RepID=UPI00222572D1|nr:uncharacterized protein F5J12DRAFT_455495 [Pisolithus orientalis]KAI6025946.1 hypothetical protein F5J12DRAFT_455495 [Pisolithus orientalis]